MLTVLRWVSVNLVSFQGMFQHLIPEGNDCILSEVYALAHTCNGDAAFVH